MVKFLCAGVMATPVSLVLVALLAGGAGPAQAAASQLAASCAQSAGSFVVDGSSVRMLVAGDAASDDPASTAVTCLARAAGIPLDDAGQAELGTFAGWTVTLDQGGRRVFTSTTQG